jgi:hypothetical protein
MNRFLKFLAAAFIGGFVIGMLFGGHPAHFWLNIIWGLCIAYVYVEGAES